MILTEVVKSFLKDPNQGKELSSKIPQSKVLIDLNKDDLYPNTGVFFDDQQKSDGLYDLNNQNEIVFKQKSKLMKYRQLAMTSDVTLAIDEIVNEIIFSYDDQLPVKIEINEENEKLVEVITEKFEKIIKLIDIKRSLFQIVKRGYIDGLIIMHCAYDKKNTKNGIQSIKMIEPAMLYFDYKTGTYKYINENRFGIPIKNDDEYSPEEIVREDFGLYDDKLNLGYLEYAIKPANLLRTLEDLLVPLRFSRSISRRVFNVDIGDLPNKRGKEVMDEHQTKFKYKKFYNNETGEVSNQQHITSMVEDYWFSNRSGGRGTTVDVLDESGNLGELGDILYFSQKLFASMNVPSNRINLNPDADRDFDYDSTRVTKEDMKFFMFISRLRQVYSSLFKEILKKEIIATEVMSQSEWEAKEDFISIPFVNENKFIEKMKINVLMEKIEAYTTIQEYAGKIFSYKKAMKKIFNFTDDEIDENIKEIAKEKKDPKFADFYTTEEDF